MRTILLIFPHQLYRDHPGLDEDPDSVAFIEDSLFFSDWHYRMRFHKQKLWLHRASMKRLQATWLRAGRHVDYLDFDPVAQSLQRHLRRLAGRRKTRFLVADPVDFNAAETTAAIPTELSKRNPAFPGDTGILESPRTECGLSRGDSYDWVMVPNAYAMSQHADGGLITTKPYFSGSAYILKMSHYRREAWCDIWEGLYWRWIWKHRQALSKNPRWSMMCRMAEKMDPGKRHRHIQVADDYLNKLSEVSGQSC